MWEKEKLINLNSSKDAWLKQKQGCNMSFAINTNIGVLQAFNALTKVNAQSQKAQLRLATNKKINSVGDDTSGYNVGKKLEAQTMRQKAQLNNVSSAKNYLSTAETALQQINDKLNQISQKYTDAQDPLKDKASVAADIRTLAKEVDSILKNTNINGTNLLAAADGTTLTGAPTFDVGGSTFTADFAESSILNASAIKSLLYGNSTDPGVSSYSTSGFIANDSVSPSTTTSTLKMTFADGTSTTFNVNLTGATKKSDILMRFMAAATTQSNYFEVGGAYLTNPPYTGYLDLHYHYNPMNINDHGPNIVSFETISGYDVTGALGVTRISSGTMAPGLTSTDTDDVLSVAADISTAADNVKAALSKIGNLLQTLDSRSEYLTSAIANNTSTISSIFDADMADEQLNATKGSIAGQVGMSIMSQLNTAPQQLMTLFR